MLAVIHLQGGRERSWQHLSLIYMSVYISYANCNQQKEGKFRKRKDVISIKKKRTMHLVSEMLAFKVRHHWLLSSFVLLTMKFYVTKPPFLMVKPLFHCRKECSAEELLEDMDNKTHKQTNKHFFWAYSRSPVLHFTRLCRVWGAKTFLYCLFVRLFMNNMGIADLEIIWC